MRMILESALRKVLRNTVDKSQYDKIMDALNQTKKVEAIPINYIENFAKWHDPVYQTNLKNLIEEYRRSTPSGGDDDSRTVY